jgi:muconolactone delta-isomerase
MFLVNHEVTRPDGISDETWHDALARERVTAVERLGNGVISAIWRVPGASANWALWDVDSRGELDALLHDLPLARWSTFVVHVLEPHPLTQQQVDQEHDARQ